MNTYDFTLNPYSGCSFGCSYCYAAFFTRDQAQQDNWGLWVNAKQNAAQLIEDLKPGELDGKRIYMSSVTDPYQPLEQRILLTQQILEAMAKHHRPKLVVQTRSPLVTRDIPLFQEIEQRGGRVQVNMTVTTDDEDVSVEKPMPTATTSGAGYLVEPEARAFHGSDHGSDRQHTAPRSIDEPIHTVTPLTGGGSFLVEPSTESFLLGQQSGGAPTSTDQPAPTVATDGYITLVQPAVIECYGHNHARAGDDPLSVITPMNKHGLVKATLVEYYGRSGGADIDEPLPTVTAKARHGLADPVLI